MTLLFNLFLLALAAGLIVSLMALTVIGYFLV